MFRWLTLGITLCCASGTAVGQSRSGRRFAEPLAVRPAGLHLRSCLPGAPTKTESPSPCLVLGLEVLSLAPSGSLTMRHVDYRVTPALAQKITNDFGGFSPIVARLVAGELQTKSMAEPSLDRVVDRTVRSLFDALPYRVLPHVTLSQAVERRVALLATLFRRRSGKRLVITSGSRTAAGQAAAMVGKLRRRGRFLRLYRKRKLAREVYDAYRAGVRARLGRAQLTATVAEVLRAQVRRGEYVSAHLRQGAVDLRSRGMRRRHKRLLRRLARSIWGMRLIREERRPPHFHLEVQTKR